MPGTAYISVTTIASERKAFLDVRSKHYLDPSGHLLLLRSSKPLRTRTV
jgi:hypothetical protein